MRSLTAAILLAALVWLGAAELVPASVRVNPAGSKLDLTFMGFGVYQTGLTAELEGFFDSSDQFPATFNNRQILDALFAPPFDINDAISLADQLIQVGLLFLR